MRSDITSLIDVLTNPRFIKGCVPKCCYIAHRWAWNKMAINVCDGATNSSLNRTLLQIGIRLLHDLTADVSSVTKRFRVRYNLLDSSACHTVTFRTPTLFTSDTGLDMCFYMLSKHSRRHEEQLIRPTQLHSVVFYSVLYGYRILPWRNHIGENLNL